MAIARRAQMPCDARKNKVGSLCCRHVGACRPCIANFPIALALESQIPPTGKKTEIKGETKHFGDFVGVSFQPAETTGNSAACMHVSALGTVLSLASFQEKNFQQIVRLSQKKKQNIFVWLRACLMALSCSDGLRKK